MLRLVRPARGSFGSDPQRQASGLSAAAGASSIAGGVAIRPQEHHQKVSRRLRANVEEAALRASAIFTPSFASFSISNSHGPSWLLAEATRQVARGMSVAECQRAVRSDRVVPERPAAPPSTRHVQRHTGNSAAASSGRTRAPATEVDLAQEPPSCMRM